MLCVLTINCCKHVMWGFILDYKVTRTFHITCLQQLIVSTQSMNNMKFAACTGLIESLVLDWSDFDGFGLHLESSFGSPDHALCVRLREACSFGCLLGLIIGLHTVQELLGH